MSEIPPAHAPQATRSGRRRRLHQAAQRV